MCHSRDEQTDVEDRHLRSRTQSWAIFALVDVVDSQDVGKEDAVEAIVVEELGQADPVVESLLFLGWVSP